MSTIAVLNASTVVSNDDVDQAVNALQRQVDDDVHPIWGLRADLEFVSNASRAPARAWQLVVLDTSDQADALGYHDVTQAGTPLGKAFAKSDIDHGYSWTVTLSHELIEMLGDPEINLCAQDGGRLWAYELCDPCEDDSFAYEIDGIKVSDFVTPAWFRPTSGMNGPFDRQNKIPKALGILRNGYAQFLDLAGSAGWQQIGAEKLTARQRPRVGSRRERRRVGHASWQASTVS